MALGVSNLNTLNLLTKEAADVSSKEVTAVEDLIGAAGRKYIGAPDRAEGRQSVPGSGMSQACNMKGRRVQQRNLAGWSS